MNPVVVALARWPKQAAGNYIRGLTRKNKLDFLQIVALGGPMLVAVVLTFGTRLVAQIGVPQPEVQFAIWLVVGAILALYIFQSVEPFAAPGFLSTQPVAKAVLRNVRRRLMIPIVAPLGVAVALVGLLIGHFLGSLQSILVFVLPFEIGLLLGIVGGEFLSRRVVGGIGAASTSLRGRPIAPTPFARIYRRHGPTALWWRHQGRQRGGLLTLKIAVCGLVVIMLAVFALVQQAPWAWPALIWFVGCICLLEELNMSGFASRVLLVQPQRFLRVLADAAWRPLGIAFAIVAALGALGLVLGAVTSVALLGSLAAFSGIAIFYLCCLLFARGNRRAALIVFGACLLLVLGNSDYLREGTPFVLLAIGIGLLRAARSNYLWPSRKI